MSATLPPCTERMAKKQLIGKCRICGETGPLTFEHIPCRKAFNNHTVLETKILELIGREHLDDLRGPQNQKGSGAFVLCDSCNYLSGTWYGNEYIRWAKQGMELIPQTVVCPSVILPAVLCPLNVLKQIVSMMCSVNSPEFADARPWVRKFVLNRHSREWDPYFRIYMNLNVSDRSRLGGSQGILKDTTTHVISEVVHPPFSYVLTHNSPPPSERLVDITFFVESKYNELRKVWLRLPVVSIYTYLPGDFRSKEEILKVANE